MTRASKAMGYFSTALWLLSALLICASARPAGGGGEPRLTSQRVAQRAWWPTSGKPAANEYAGAQACAECHKSIVHAQQQTRMARTSRRAGESSLLTLNQHLTLRKSGVETEIATASDKSFYSAKRGGETITGQVLWTMGDGEIGTTFVLESKAKLFESQLSYFTALQGLDLTPGHTWEEVKDVEHAFGEPQEPKEAQRCFSCHTTASTAQGRFDLTQAMAGVSCEACHGPGARHVQAMKEGREQEGEAAIFNPGMLNPVEQVDFCGACHRAPLDVQAEREQTAVNIRFQPYRLAKSRCWKRPDARLACSTCHSPHSNLLRDPASYDSKCLACHRAGKSISEPESAKAAAPTEPGCPVGTARCVTCHMPRYQLPQLHGWFTDHFIRIVRPGEPFPL